MVTKFQIIRDLKFLWKQLLIVEHLRLHNRRQQLKLIQTCVQTESRDRYAMA